jgi:hypothetical protein
VASRVTADGFVEITTPGERLAAGTRYRIVGLEDDPPGRAPTEAEMASRWVPGPVQPRTLTYYDEPLFSSGTVVCSYYSSPGSEEVE